MSPCRGSADGTWGSDSSESGENVDRGPLGPGDLPVVANVRRGLEGLIEITEYTSTKILGITLRSRRQWLEFMQIGHINSLCTHCL